MTKSTKSAKEIEREIEMKRKTNLGKSRDEEGCHERF